MGKLSEVTDNYITVRITGELGNQMFGLATGLAQAHRLDCNLRLDFQGLPNRLERFILDSKISIINTSKEKTSVIAGSTPNRLLPMTQQLKSLVRKRVSLRKQKFFKQSKYQYSAANPETSIFHEISSHEFSDSINEVNIGTTLVGYFQSWKYFRNTDIKSVFAVYDEVDFREKYNLPPVFTALHIRVYSEPYRDFHGLLNVDYYVNAIKQLRKDKKLFPIVAFTDNPEGAQDILNAIRDDLHSVLSPRDVSDQVENLAVMKLGASFIGANSSYSWWAAYLGEYEGGDCIFPRPWYRGSEQTDKDLYLPAWETIGGDIYKKLS